MCTFLTMKDIYLGRFGMCKGDDDTELSLPVYYSYSTGVYLMHEGTRYTYGFNRKEVDERLGPKVMEVLKTMHKMTSGKVKLTRGSKASNLQRA